MNGVRDDASMDSKGRGQRADGPGNSQEEHDHPPSDVVQNVKMPDVQDAQMKVTGSFFHVDGVGLLDENLVRSNPWVLDQNSARCMPGCMPNMPNMPMTSAPGFLSTQPRNAANAATSVDSCLSPSPVLSTAPVCAPNVSMARVPQVWPAGTTVIIDGLMTCPTFNGLNGLIDSYDAETNRYNVQLPLTDSSLFC